MISLPAWDSIYWRSLNLVAIGSVSPKFFFFLWMEENRQLGKERTSESTALSSVDIWLRRQGSTIPAGLEHGPIVIVYIWNRISVLNNENFHLCMYVRTIISYIFWSAEAPLITNRSILTTTYPYLCRYFPLPTRNETTIYSLSTFQTISMKLHEPWVLHVLGPHGIYYHPLFTPFAVKPSICPLSIPIFYRELVICIILHMYVRAKKEKEKK